MAVEGVKGRQAAFIFVFVTVALDMLALGIVIPVLPKLIESFMAGDTARAAVIVGVFGTIWALIQFFASPMAGALSDRFGRRPIILLSNLGLGLDYVLMALAPTLSWLFVGRLISGVTSASVSTASAYIADVTPPSDRARNFGMLGAAFGVGFVLGPAVGGFLGAYDLRLPFWGAAAMSFANFLYGVFVLPESLKPENRSTFSLAKANPVGSFRLLARSPVLIGLSATTFLSQLAHIALPTIFVLSVGYRYHWGPDDVGLILAGIGIAAVVVQAALVRPVVKLIGEWRALVLGLLAVASGFALYGIAWNGTLAWCAVPVTALGGLYNASSKSIISQQVSASEQGQLQGAISSVNALASIVGPALFSWILSRSIDPAYGLMMPGLGFLAASAALVIALLIAIWLAFFASRPKAVPVEP
jgi:MFS transporter, DHA1 family, tetracycline resistance protein